MRDVDSTIQAAGSAEHMTFEQFLVMAVLAGSLALFIWGRPRFDGVALLALLTLTIIGLVPPREAFAGFGHPAVITVAAILVISRSLAQTGLVERLVDRLMSLATRPVAYTATLCGLVGALSAFMNNVGALALMLPVAVRSAALIGRPLSRTLMPLSFASLLGGLTTLIGTPPNIIIASLREQAIGTPFAMFDFAPVGVGVAIAGIAFIVLVGWRLLPYRGAHRKDDEEPFEVDDYVTEIEIRDESPLRGNEIKEVEALAGNGIEIRGLYHHGIHAGVIAEDKPLDSGDMIVLEGDPHSLLELVRKTGIDVGTRNVVQSTGDAKAERVVVEAVISPGSVLEGMRPDRPFLNRRYRFALLAVAAQEKPVRCGFADMTLRVGDVLLLEGERQAVREDLNRLGCLPLATRQLPPAESRPSTLPVVLLTVGIVLAVSGLLPVHLSFLAVALMIVLCGCLPLRNVYESIDWPVIVLLGAFLPFGQALQDSGTTGLITKAALQIVGSLPLPVILGLLMAVSMLLSDLINNAAAAVVMGPIGVTLAEGLGVGPDAFLMAVAVGCTCTFLTPIGHQSNALVMGPGGYRFGDYWRMGLPLGVIVVSGGTLLLSIVWLP